MPLFPSLPPSPRSVVSAEEGERRAREEGVLYVECSAKTGHNVHALFRALATTLPGSTGTSAGGAGGGGEGGRGGRAAESNLVDFRVPNVHPGGEARDAPAQGGCCGAVA